jgi:hypothetical protein
VGTNELIDVVRRWWDKMGLAHVVAVRSVGSAMDDDERTKGLTYWAE